MSGPIRIDPGAITQIAQSCQRSSNELASQAQLMQSQMTQLRDALQGIPRLSIADRFDEWNKLFSNLSSSLGESNSYLQNLVQQIDSFVSSLGQ